jgi:transposase
MDRDRDELTLALLRAPDDPPQFNGPDPEAYLADVIDRMARDPINRLAELLPWNWQRQPARMAA